MELEWVAHYEDGTCFPQFCPTGEENKWGDVDIDSVRVVGLYPYVDGEIMPFPHFEVPITEGMKPIVFRRKAITVNLSGAIVKEEVNYAVGYIKEGVKCIMIIDGNGSVSMVNE